MNTEMINRLAGRLTAEEIQEMQELVRLAAMNEELIACQSAEIDSLHRELGNLYLHLHQSQQALRQMTALNTHAVASIGQN